MADAANHWHDLYRAQCLLRQDDAARFGQRILTLEDGIEQYDTRLAEAFAEIEALRGNQLVQARHIAKLSDACRMLLSALDEVDDYPAQEAAQEFAKKVLEGK